MKKYNVGDAVWVARAGYRRVAELCPVCFGKLQVVLTLGNDDTVTLPCDYCGKGYNVPAGTVTEARYSPGAELKTIETVSVSQTTSGETYEYRSGDYILSPERVFDTKEEALFCCESIAQELNKEQETRTEYIKQYIKKSFSWNAGYHLREARRKEDEAERHRKKAAICKSRGKDL